jgi:hypothetical protein
MTQYNRVLKQKNDIIGKHTQVLENRKTAYDGAKTHHKTEVSDLKSSWKRKEQDLKETYNTDIRTKEIEKWCLTAQVNQLEWDKTSKSFVLEKLQGTLVKDRPSLSKVKGIYVEAHCKLNGLAELNKRSWVQV